MIKKCFFPGGSVFFQAGKFSANLLLGAYCTNYYGSSRVSTPLEAKTEVFHAHMYTLGQNEQGGDGIVADAPLIELP